jgi:outer membrane protein OmpA-like peptidoglycan-associated protein/tetratricopeptide (TPR) repeat protein
MVIFFLLINLFPSAGQENVKIRRAKFKMAKEGFKDAWKAVKLGNEKFTLGKGMYWQARENFLKAYDYNPGNAELNYKIGACYLFTDDKFKAITYLRKAYLAKPKVSEDIHFLMARAFHLVLNFDTAILEYNIFKNNLRPKELGEWAAKINKYIEECQNGRDLVRSPVRVIISDLGDSINSTYDDYNSVFTSNDSLLYFTSRRKVNKKSKLSPVDYKYYEDVYVSHKVGNKWSMAKNLGKPINTEHNDAVVALSDNDTKLYVYNGYKNGGDVQVSKLRKNKWTRPKPLPRKFRSKYHESSYYFAPDSSAIYFVSAPKRNTVGGKDIFVSYRKENGAWAKPVNLGKTINTPYDEEGVSLSKDGKVLYFSSKGHNSMGGYDVFKSVKDSLGKWTTPINMGYPINSPDDELFYYEDKTSPKYGYYTATRDGGLGGKDIYKITFLGEEKEAIMTTDEQLYAWPNEIAPSIFFTIPDYLALDTSMVLQGRIFNAKTQEPVIGKLDLIDVVHSAVIGTAISDSSGNYKITIPGKKNYGVEIMAKDYLYFLQTIDLTKDTAELVIKRDFAVSKVEVGAKVVLKNIFFETAKAALKSESFTELENVIKFLNDNPTVRLEISGHTDNVGSLKANTKLSQDRAQSVVNYLVSKGIAASRLEAKGYAFTQPLATNDSSDGRAQNRRVEFKILSK